jgi:hypothetical protein
MRKISSPTELTSELRALLTYVEGSEPSRAKIASGLRALAGRVASGDAAAKDKDEDKDDDGAAFPGAAPPFKKKKTAAGAQGELLKRMNKGAQQAKEFTSQEPPEAVERHRKSMLGNLESQRKYLIRATAYPPRSGGMMSMADDLATEAEGCAQFMGYLWGLDN